MWYRGVGGLFAMLTVSGLLLAEETRGTVTKVEKGSITVRSGVGFGKDKTEATEKTFKISGDVKVTRTVGKDKDKETVNLTVDELKTAVKVTNVFVTVVHDGDNASEIQVGFRGGFGKKKKTDDK